MDIDTYVVVLVINAQRGGIIGPNCIWCERLFVLRNFTYHGVVSVTKKN